MADSVRGGWEAALETSYAPEQAVGQGATMQRPLGDRLWAVLPWAGPALLMLLVGWRGASNPSLGWDEYATATVAPRTVPQILDVGGWLDASITPYYLFMHAWIGIFGTGEIALRSPSIIAMAVGVGLVGALGRRLFTPFVGLVAGLLLVLLPATSRYAQEARAYGIAFMLVVLATLLLYRAIDKPSWGRWIWYGVVILLIGLLHLLGLLALAGHAYIMLTRPSTAGVLRRWATVTALAVVGSAPLIVVGLNQQGRQLGWIDPVTVEVVRRAPLELVGQVAAGWLLLGLAVAAVRRKQRATVELAVLGLIPPVVLIGVSLLVDPLWVPRYMLYVLAPLALLAATALAGWWRSAIVLCVVLALVVPAQRELREPSSHAPDFRWVAATVAANQRSGDGIVYATADAKWTRAWTDYYLRGRSAVPDDLLLDRTAAQAGRLAAVECADPAACIGDAERVWLIQLTRGRPIGDDPLARAGTAAPVLRDEYRLVRTWQRGWRVISLFERSP